MASIDVVHEVAVGSTRRRYTQTFSGTLRVSIDGETVANGQTDQQATIALDVSAVKAFFIASDQDITVETNSGSTPADTLALKADVPYMWCTDSIDTFQLGTDVTALFFTNASGSTATVNLEAIVDPSP